MKGNRKSRKNHRKDRKPFALNVGRVKKGKYGFKHEEFDDMKSLLARASKIEKSRGYDQGLRELQIAIHA